MDKILFANVKSEFEKQCNTQNTGSNIVDDPMLDQTTVFLVSDNQKGNLSMKAIYSISPRNNEMMYRIVSAIVSAKKLTQFKIKRIGYTDLRTQ